MGEKESDPNPYQLEDFFCVKFSKTTDKYALKASAWPTVQILEQQQ